MSRRRIMAPLAAAGVALALTLPGGLVGAQEAGPTVTVYVSACDVVGTGSSGTIQTDVAPPAAFTNCAAVDLNAADWGLTVDGLAPDSFGGNEAVWENRGNGPHIADTGMGSTGSTLEFTIDGEDVVLYAFYGRAVEPTPTTAPDEPTPTDVPAETVTPGETVTAIATTPAVDPTATTPAEQLPNTGAGAGSETGVGIALAALAASAVAGTAGLALRRRK